MSFPEKRVTPSCCVCSGEISDPDDLYFITQLTSYSVFDWPVHLHCAPFVSLHYGVQLRKPLAPHELRDIVDDSDSLIIAGGG